MRHSSIIIFTLFLASSLLAGSIFSEYNAVPQNDQVNLTWVTSSETNVASFQILRSNDSEIFVELKKLNPKGPGNLYEYIDESVMFKSSGVIFYKIRALDKRNVLIEESVMIVKTQVSDMRETWGAIKAIFK